MWLLKHFYAKISGKIIYHIIKCSAFGLFAPSPLWTPLADFRPPGPLPIILTVNRRRCFWEQWIQHVTGWGCRNPPLLKSWGVFKFNMISDVICHLILWNRCTRVIDMGAFGVWLIGLHFQHPFRAFPFLHCLMLVTLSTLPRSMQCTRPLFLRSVASIHLWRGRWMMEGRLRGARSAGWLRPPEHSPRNFLKICSCKSIYFSIFWHRLTIFCTNTSSYLDLGKWLGPGNGGGIVKRKRRDEKGGKGALCPCTQG